MENVPVLCGEARRPVRAGGASGESSTRKADAGQAAGSAACADKKKPGRRSRPGVMGETPDQYLLKAEGSSSSTSTVPAFFRASS